MSLISNLKKQVDIPVWEWTRFAPNTSSAVSSATAANNSLYHVNHGRYIYYMQAIGTLAGATSVGTGFWRYDTVTDTFQQLAFPPIAPTTFSSMQFVGGQGYYGRVISAEAQNITCAALTGQVLSTYDIRIVGGTGLGQHRVITSVTDPIVVDSGTLTSAPTSPQLTMIDANKNWTVNEWVGYQVRFVAATGNSVVRKIIYNSPTTLYFSDVNKYAEELNAYTPIVTITGSALTIGAVGTQYQIEYSTLTVDSPWTTPPDATSRFLIHSGGIWLISSGTTYTLQYYDVAADTWYVRNSCTGAATGPVSGAGTDGTIMNTGEIALMSDRGAATGSQTSTTLQDTTKSWTVNAFSDFGSHIRILSGTGWGQVRTIISNTSNTITVSPAWTTTPDSTSLYAVDSLDSGTVSSAANSNQTAVATGCTIMGNVMTIGAMSSGAFYAGQVLTGTGVMANTTVITKSGACFTAGLNTTVILSQGDTTGITAGMIVTLIAGSGALSAVGTQVVSTTTYTVTLSLAPTTALANATLQFMAGYMSASGATSNGNIITVGSTTNLVRGMYVTKFSGTGTIPADAYVLDIISVTQFSISSTPTVALSASAVVIGTVFQTIISNQLTGIPGGVGTYNIWPPQTVTSTTITATGVATLTDNSKLWCLHRWNGQSVRIVSGTGIGQVRSIVGTKGSNTIDYTSAVGATSLGNVITVTDVTGLVAGMQVTVTAGVGEFAWDTNVVSINVGANTFVTSKVPTISLSGGSSVVKATENNTIFVTPAWTTVPDNTSNYVIHGDPDKLFFSLATQTPTFVHNIEADTVTQGRRLEQGVARGMAAQYSDHPAVAIVSSVPVQPINYIFGNATSVTAYFGMGPFLTTGFSAATGTVTITFTTYPGSTYTGTTTIPVGSLITTSGITTSGAFTNGDFVVTASSAGSVSFTNAGTGTQTVAGILSSGQKLNPALAAIAQIQGCVPALYNSASITTTAAGAGYITYANTTVGPLTTTGFIQHLPQATTACTISGTTATVTVAGTYFPIGSYVSVVGVSTIAAATSGSYNGVYQVTASSAGSCSFVIPTNTPTGTAAVQGTIQAATLMQWVSTVNPHNFKAGMMVNHIGDMHFARSCVNISAPVYPVTNPVAASMNQYLFPTGTGLYNSAAGATNSSTTVTVVSVTGLTVGMIVTIASGTGTFVPGTSVVSINVGANTFVVSTAPTVNLSASAVVRGSPYAGTAIVYPQATTVLTDCTKNWVPNQYANCQVAYNSTQGNGAGTNPAVLSAYIIANTPTQLIFSAPYTLPVQGVTRYVITMPSVSQNNSVLGAADSGLALGAQLVTQIQDITKFWAMPANVTGQVASGATSGAGTITITTGLADRIFPGMVVVATAGTCIASTLTTTIKVASMTGLVVTLSGGTLTGTTGSTTFTFMAVASSSGNTVTLSGYTTQGLQVGMNVGVLSVDNIKIASGAVALPVTGTFVNNGGVILTNVKVTQVIDGTSFKVSSVPTTALLNANVFASFWFTGQWNGRRVRYTTGYTAAATAYVEAIITGTTTNGIITFATTTPALAVTAQTGYAIFQQPNRGLGTSLLWNFGQADQIKRGVYMYQARGGGVTGWDRLNMQNDYWEFLTPTPNYEVLQTGAMYAYDGGDRIYFTPQVTQRVYYFDIATQKIEGGSQYPYAVGSVIIGNRMEIFETVDGLKYLWLNRHGFQECFKQLLFY